MHRAAIYIILGLVVLGLLIYGAIRAQMRQAQMLKLLEDQGAQLSAMVRMLERIALAQENRSK